MTDTQNTQDTKLTEAQQEWVDALRGGKYKQGKKVLHNANNNTYCCLGVACDLFIKKFPGQITECVERWLGGPDLYVYYRDGEETTVSVLLPKVQKWLNLRTCDGEFIPGLSLWQLNDDSYYTFEQIARIIESKPEGLFINE